MIVAAVIALALTTSPAETRRAAKLAHRSIIEYNAGDFPRALADITAAYELDPRPALLYNLGQCHRAAGNAARALFFYQGYLREEPESPKRASVLLLIKDLEAKLNPKAVAPAPVVEWIPTPAVPDAPPPPAVAEPVPAAAVWADTSVAPARSNAPWWLVGTGAVVAAVGGGLVIGEVASKKAVSSITSSSAQTANAVGYAGQGALGVGVVVVVVGVVWALVRPPTEPAR